MPPIKDQDALFASRYQYIRWEHCQTCGECVEVWLSPGKREWRFDPMPSHESPAIQHYETCTPKENNNGTTGSAVQDTSGRDSNSGNGVGPGQQGAPVRVSEKPRTSLPGNLQVGGHDARSIKLHGVTDPNYQLLAAGWYDGTLVCQFKTAKWAYGPYVPEAEYLKLRNSPYAYRIFTSNIKNKFTATKLE